MTEKKAKALKGRALITNNNLNFFFFHKEINNLKMKKLGAFLPLNKIYYFYFLFFLQISAALSEKANGGFYNGILILQQL